MAGYNWSAEDIIQRIHVAKGNVAAVARSLGCSRKTLYNYINTRSTVQDAIAEARETMLDNAESVLYRKVLEGSTPELLFFLKTQGKTRGYVEKAKGTEDDPLHISVQAIDYRDGLTSVAPGPIPDSSAPSENESSVDG